MMKSMKTTLAFLFLLSMVQLFGQDTTFILKNRTPFFYHAIFIEPNKDSKYYDYIADFKFNRYDEREHAAYIKTLKEQTSAPFSHFNYGKLPLKWCSLYRYQGQFYVYSPSDYIANYKVAISDSTFIAFPGEIVVNRIQSFEQKNAKTYHFKFITFQNKKESVIIHWIDHKKGIAIFEMPGAMPQHRYEFMVQADKVKNFPLIVNYCDKEKQEEFEGFDKVDFKKWLGQK